jgi:lactoylglutathione lyase
MQPGVHCHAIETAKLLPIAPRSKKAARALHRTAFYTTADFAVPSVYTIINRWRRKWLRVNATILECNAELGPSARRGDGHAPTRPLKSASAQLHARLDTERRGKRHAKNKGRATMPIVTWDHIHLRSPDPEATAAWLEDILGGEIVRGPGRIDVKLGGANVFIAPVTAGDGVHTPPLTPYQGLDHFGLTVKDIDAVAAEIKAKGVEFTKEPTTIRPGVRICFIRGPQGISVELLERDKKYA